MRLLKNLLKLTMCAVSNVLLPVIAIMTVMVFVDFTTLTVNSSADVSSIMHRIRTNKSFFDLFASAYNMITLMITSHIGIVLCLGKIRKSNNVDLTIGFYCEDILFCEKRKEKKKFTANIIGYLRI